MNVIIMLKVSGCCRNFSSIITTSRASYHEVWLCFRFPAFSPPCFVQKVVIKKANIFTMRESRTLVAVFTETVKVEGIIILGKSGEPKYKHTRIIWGNIKVTD